jgi:hypothetical protein
MGAAVLLVVTLAGCDLSSDSEEREERLGTERRPAAPAAGKSTEERVIRGWVEALNAGEYERAADFFARGAVVEQIVEARLTDRKSAIAFNRGLPCRADLTDVEDEGRSVLGAFRLREGRRPGTESCKNGEARVRFVIRRGKIREWRQLPGSSLPEVRIARYASPRSAVI